MCPSAPDAGPLLPRLHRLTRSDSTTRNARKAQRLSTTYDELERRIERLQEQEELAAVRPELDGNEIGQVLGIRPGPVLGRAYKHLLEVRLDRGVIGREAVEAELRSWWAQQPESGGQPGTGTPRETGGQPGTGGEPDGRPGGGVTRR